MRTIGSVLLGVVAALVTGGCSSPGGGGSASDAGLTFGAVDPGFRRPGSTIVQNAFDPLDLPEPNELRLGSGFPGPDYWQQRVDYIIDATIDAETDALSASWEMTYHNNSPHELEYLWIQLEQNLFRSDSLGSRSYSPGGVLRGRPDFDGGYTISGVKIHVDGGAGGGAGGGVISTDLLVYDTLGRLDLPEALEPGASITVSLDYSFPVPPYLRRMGVEEVEQGKIFEFAQWFPHACKYDDVSGWNTLPYLGTGEFYTDFGSYDVSVTVPGDYLVVATGELQNASEVLSAPIRERLDEAIASDEPVYIVRQQEIGSTMMFPGDEDMRTWRFTADDVRTFAFAASDAFIWDAAGADVTDLENNARRVLVQSFYPEEAEVWFPEHEDGGSTRFTKHAVEFYSEWLYPYPYSHMTNVNGPEGGMEYPMIMFCGARTNAKGLFGVTDHEVGHTWFPMIVNTDERRHVWMDEGFNSFTDAYSERAWFGEDELDWVRTQNRLREFANEPNLQPISTRPDAMWRRWVGLLGYRKPGIGMTILREYIMGPERFDTAFRAYIQKWAFKSPQPADFFRAMEDGAGMELDWFFRSWFMGTGSIDFAIEDASAAEDGESGYVTFVNNGEVPLPLPYRVTLTDGTVLDLELPVEAWANSDKYRAVFNAFGQRIERVEIDPRGLIPDINPRDNVWGN